MKHGNNETREIAEKGTILRCQVGSGAHGINIVGTDDRDEMGICIEPPEYVIGLRRFEQYEYRTQPQGKRSGAGDLDLVVYSLRKWMRLALKGNPSVLVPLFAGPGDVVASTIAGTELRNRADMILSRQAGYRFLGYMRAQRERLMGIRGNRHTNRPEVVAQFGYDTKFAGHMIRLGMQGVELLETGRITMPMPPEHSHYIRQVRVGAISKEHAMAEAEYWESELEYLVDKSYLPEFPNFDEANLWLFKTYQRQWRQWGYELPDGGS